MGEIFCRVAERKMTHSKLSLHQIWLIFGLLVTWSSSERRLPDHMLTTPFLNTTPDIVPSKGFATLSLSTMGRRQTIVYEIGKSLCPYNDYCRRKKEALPFGGHPCCEDCSCEDNCWETKNCCPDKKELIDTREPIRNCHVTIVKKRNKTVLYNGINYGIKAYRIIDYCPESERNVSIINKCTLLDIDHISDYNWVSNNSTGTIYQNKFCASCHGETGLTEWRMEARCEDVLYSNFSQLKSLLLSEKCDIINREPSYNRVDNLYKPCAIPFYTHCNQTGLWNKYDADIAWACNIHDATFLKEPHIGIHVYAYKNAFCYVCNEKKIISAIPICRSTISNTRDDGGLVFTTLIDYKRDDYLESYRPASDYACEENEMFDPYLRKCRTLICPFANVPFYGNCKQLVEQTYSLSMEVIYTLTVLESSMDISLTDEMTQFGDFFNKLFRDLRVHVFKSGGQCLHCYQHFRLLKDIERSTNIHNDSNMNTGNNSYTDPNMLFYSIWYTDDNCHLQKLTNDALEFAGSTIRFEFNENRTMSLKVAHLVENVQHFIRQGKVIAESRRYPNCFVTYKLTTKVICPQTKINFSEFEPFLTEHNAEVIKSLFTTTQMRSKEYKNICVDDYFGKLSDGNFKLMQNSCSFQLRIKTVISINTVVLTLLI